jgi:ParB/RepB/Spo0J family partition protein
MKESVNMSGKHASSVVWRLSRLKEHPEQAAMFGDVSDEELKALAEDMDKNGQRDPVHILPDGVILAGHQRVRAARLLGWKEIEVIVRDDLAEAGPQAQETFLVNDNLLRRHLSPLGRARCLRRLMELESNSRTGGLDWKSKEALKEQLGRRLNLSLRSVNRYLLVLGTPPEVQAAFDRGAITLIQAGKVALLDRQQQEDVARRLHNGERAKEVMARTLANGQDGSGDVQRSFVRLVGALQREEPLLRGGQGQIRPGRLKNSLPVLKKATTLLKRLVAQAEEAE